MKIFKSLLGLIVLKSPLEQNQQNIKMPFIHM